MLMFVDSFDYDYEIHDHRMNPFNKSARAEESSLCYGMNNCVKQCS